MTSPHLSPHVRSGSTYYFSGQLAFDDGSQIVGSDIGTQTTRVLSNIGKALDDAQLSVKDIVKTTVWLQNRADFPGFNAAYAQYFGDHRPARSTVICQLVVPEALVEIEVVAIRER